MRDALDPIELAMVAQSVGEEQSRKSRAWGKKRKEHPMDPVLADSPKPLGCMTCCTRAFWSRDSRMITRIGDATLDHDRTTFGLRLSS